VFGDSRGPNRAEALTLMAKTEKETTELIVRLKGLSASHASALANAISGVILLLLSNPDSLSLDLITITDEFENRLKLLIGA
jgi:hypothetical protein